MDRVLVRRCGRTAHSAQRATLPRKWHISCETGMRRLGCVRERQVQHFVEPENQVPPAESASLFDAGSSTDTPSRSPAGSPASRDERETWLCELASLLVAHD